MAPFGWVLAGFVAGVGLTSAAFVTLSTVPQGEAAAPAAKAISPPTEVLAAGGETAGEPIDLTEDSKPEPIDNDPLGELDVRARVAMMRWMAANPQYEFVMRDYCRCRTMPETQCPEYQRERERERAEYPYTDVGDYNKDGQRDFAIILALKGKEGPDRLLIFNGPFGDEIPTPAYSGEGMERDDQVHDGYFGPTESDNGYVFVAKGKTYELKYVGDPQ